MDLMRTISVYIINFQFQKTKMIDLSDRGREKFYEEFFGKIKNIRKENIPDSDKYRLMNLQIVALNSYENQRKIYQTSIRTYWNLKKSQMKIERNEEEIIGTKTSETLEREIYKKI